MNKNQFIKICADRRLWNLIKKVSIVEYEEVTDKKDFLNKVYKKIHNRTYYPLPPRAYLSHNKGKGVLRIIPALSLQDLLVYYYCVRMLEPYIALNHIPGTYGGFGLSGKLRKVEEDEIKNIKASHEIIEIQGNSYVFTEIDGYITLSTLNAKAWGAAWGDYTEKLYFTLAAYKTGALAELDISNFYDSISLDNLEFKIRKNIPPKLNEEVYLLFHFLRFWNRHINFYRQQGVGLPQDVFGECSRILANYYLQDYDKKIYEFCKKKSAKYFRYADDQVVFAKDEKDLEEIITKASSFLMREGLNFNQKKIKIMTAKEFNRYHSFNNFIKLSPRSKPTASTIESQINFYFKNKKYLRKQGYTLLKRILRVSKDIKIKPKNINLIKNHILSINFLSQYFHQLDDLQLIYDLLNPREKAKLIKILNALIDKCFYTNYLYNLRKFYQKNRIRNLRQIRSRMIWLGHFYDFERSYKIRQSSI